jgi:hypothetical protein
MGWLHLKLHEVVYEVKLYNILKHRILIAMKSHQKHLNIIICLEVMLKVMRVARAPALKMLLLMACLLASEEAAQALSPPGGSLLPDDRTSKPRACTMPSIASNIQAPSMR